MSELCLLAAVSLATSQGEPPALPLDRTAQEIQQLSDDRTTCEAGQRMAIAPGTETVPPEFSPSSGQSRPQSSVLLIDSETSGGSGASTRASSSEFNDLSPSELLAVPIWRVSDASGPFAEEERLSVSEGSLPEVSPVPKPVGEIRRQSPLAIPEAQEQITPWTSSLDPAPSSPASAASPPEAVSGGQSMSVWADASPELTSEPVAVSVSEAAPEVVSFSFSVPQPQTKAVRPASGSQFYQQRWAALQAGQSYTRLTSDSFIQQWLYTSYEPTHEDWVNLLAHEARAMSRGQGSNRLTVMVGDSISLWFPTDYMARYRFWLNQSISGDTAAGTLQRLSLFNQTRPDIIHVMVGINDLRRGVSDAQLLANQQQILRRLRQQHPNAQIIAHSILPTRLPTLTGDRIQRINANLEAIATQEGARYLDLYRYFSDGQGGINPDLTTDGLHLNPQGYALWFAVLQQFNLV